MVSINIIKKKTDNNNIVPTRRAYQLITISFR